jgi:hypothetical protein
MELHRGDCSPLDPSGDPVAWRRFGERVRAAVAPELARHAARSRRRAVLDAWTRPVLAAAALLAVVGGGVLTVFNVRTQPTTIPGVADALGLPTAFGEWLEAGRSPTVEELVVALEGRTQ